MAITQRRAVTLGVAFAANAIRFKGLAPKPLELPTAAWINPPKKDLALAPFPPLQPIHALGWIIQDE